MDELFNKLKSEPPVKKYDSTANLKENNDMECNTSVRRESMPPPASPVVIKNLNKSRSMSPQAMPAVGPKKVPKKRNENSAEKVTAPPSRQSMPPPISPVVIKKPIKSRSNSPDGGTKPLKVRVERVQSQEQSPISEKEEMKTKSQPKELGESQKSPKEKINSPVKQEEKSIQKTKESPKKLPTKAQQKLFDPSVLKQAQKLKQFRVKSCMVRIQRMDLRKEQKRLSLTKKTTPPKNVVSPPKNERKRQLPTNPTQTSPTNKKQKPGFFIKLSTHANVSPGSAKSGKQKSPKQQQSVKSPAAAASKSPAASAPKSPAAAAPKSPAASTAKSPAASAPKSPAASTPKSLPEKKIKMGTVKEKIHKKRVSQLSKSLTTPSKFTRTQLVKKFGKRFLSSCVKIERCKHPLMLTFESNARARKLQTKRNSARNLSVSFREQVEIIGDSGSDSEPDASEDDLEIFASTSQAALKKLQPNSSLPIMPTRLKKVENGKVIDDIDIDPNLFIDPQDTDTSTPLNAAALKKREKKSYSPLKGDGTPSPRKEQLKLANEKLPPSGLRRLHIDCVEDEDEDDDCEYIVPIDIPQRHASVTNSIKTPKGSKVPEKVLDFTKDKDKYMGKPDEINVSESQDISDKSTSKSDESFASAEGNITNNGEEYNNKTNGKSSVSANGSDNGKEPEDITSSDPNQLDRMLATPSPASLKKLLDAVVESNKYDKEKAEKAAYYDNEHKKLASEEGNHTNNDDGAVSLSLDEDLSMQLFVEAEDSDITRNSEHLTEEIIKENNIVDSIVSETINKLSKSISSSHESLSSGEQIPDLIPNIVLEGSVMTVE